MSVGVAEEKLLTKAVAYANSWEHLSDELLCLDLRLRLQILKQRRSQTSDPLSPFRGLVVTDTEVSDLLQTPVAAAASLAGSVERQKIDQELTAIQNQIPERRVASRQAGGYLSLPRLVELFGLTRFEEQCLVICLAPEVDRKYEKLYAYIQDDATRRRAGVDLVLNLLCRNDEEKLAAAFHRSGCLPLAALFRGCVEKERHGPANP